MQTMFTMLKGRSPGSNEPGVPDPRRLLKALHRSFFSILFLLYFLSLSAQKPTYIRSNNGEPWGSSDNIDAMDFLFGKGNWNDEYFQTVDVKKIFSPANCFIFIDGSDIGDADFESFFNSNQKEIEDWVSMGGKLFMNCAPNYNLGQYTNVGFDNTIIDWNGGSNDVVASDPNHIFFNGPFNSGTQWSGGSFSHAILSGNKLTPLIEDMWNGSSWLSLAEKDWGKGKVVFGTMTMPMFHSPNPDCYNLRYNIISNMLDCTPPAPNNAGITDFLEPKAFCAGKHDVKVMIANRGNNVLDSVRINWSVDGVLQNPIYNSIVLDTVGGNGPREIDITLGSLVFTSGVKNVIKIWTSYPNGVVDTVNNDDTLLVTLQPSLNGTYTIGGNSPSYATFADAVADLNAFGVCGPVVFNVRAGTYAERVMLKEVAGTSSTNTITFNGAGVGSTIITNTGTDFSDWSTILLEGTDYVSFNNMTVSSPGSNFGVGILLAGKADYNSFTDMIIDMNTTTNNGNVLGIAITSSPMGINYGMNGQYNKFDKLIVRGAYFGALMYGRGNGPGEYILGNEITNCEFTDQSYYGIYLEYCGRTYINNNTVKGLRDPNAYGVYLYYSNAREIMRNNITSPWLGIQLYNFNRYNYDGVRSKVNNNMIYGGSLDFAAYFYYNYYTDFFHNTIVGESQNQGAAYFSRGTNMDVRNNIFVNKASGPSAYSVYINNTGFTRFDYNIYFTNGGSLAYHNTTISNLGSWQSVFPQYNVNSIVSLPKFVSPTDFHLDIKTPPVTGLDLGITTDIDGDNRCSFSPTLGADESKFPYPTPILNIGVLDSAFAEGNTRIVSNFTTAFGERVNISWYVDGVWESDMKDFDYKFMNPGTYTVSLKVENCAGYDSVAKVITVYSPTSTPETDFVASTTSPNMFDYILLRDISKHGATKWLWSITPQDGAIISDETAANPDVFFYAAGLYDVCLTTENALGTGTTLCKKTYISVRDEVELCQGITESVSPSGRLTDDGGLAGNYGSSRQCTFLINTCGKVNLTFKTFQLSDQQDEIVVYDGENNKGKLIGRFPGGQPGIPGGSTGLTATTGKMYIEFITGASGEDVGFEAYWVTIPDTSVKSPVADFSFPSTIYPKNAAIFRTASTGSNLTYQWDFAPPTKKPGTEGGKKDFDIYSWPVAGTYDVKLKVSNCVGVDEITKQVTVADPTSAPTVGFYADKVRVPVLSRIRLFDSSGQGPTEWKWIITPSNKVKFDTDDADQNPSMYFTAPGFYTVKLIAKNSFGTDSTEQVAYIEVFNYCSPTVGVINSDMGISRVRFGNVDNFSSSGAGAYTSYFETIPAYKVIKKTNLSVTIDRPVNMQDEQSRKIWVDWNGDADFDDLGEEVAYEAPAKNVSYTATFAIPYTAITGTTVMRIGTNYKNDPNKPCGVNSSGEYEDYALQISDDDVKPIVTLNGKDTVYVERWYSYAEAGAVALDNVDGNISSTIAVSDNIDSTTEGTYYVRYNVRDAENNASDETVRVVIVTKDVTKPMLSLVGASPDKVTINTPYNDPGATAVDYHNRDISGLINVGGGVNSNKLGTYTLYYVVDDGSGNKDSIVREVEVVDDVAPEITLIGTDTLFVEVFDPYNEPGINSNDNYYASNTLTLTVDSSKVKTNKTGTYEVYYTSTDGSNNIGTYTRYVVVRDTELPVIKLIGKDTLVLNVYANYSDPGVLITDNYCTDKNWNVDNYPDLDELGDYTLTYTTTDCEGNNSLPVKRLVKVVDRIAPVIELKGYPVVNVYRWGTYIDSGITIIDNYYSESDLQPLVLTTSDGDMLYAGVYNVCYQVTDPSSNKSLKTCRVVNVKEAIGSVGEELNAAKLNVYPNPNNGQFTLAIDGGLKGTAQISIVDLLGKTVYTTTGVHGADIVELNVSELPAGVYFVKVQQLKSTSMVKVTIVK